MIWIILIFLSNLHPSLLKISIDLILAFNELKLSSSNEGSREAEWKEVIQLSLQFQKGMELRWGFDTNTSLSSSESIILENFSVKGVSVLACLVPIVLSAGYFRQLIPVTNYRCSNFKVGESTNQAWETVPN